jgi:hypothetical protein
MAQFILIFLFGVSTGICGTCLFWFSVVRKNAGAVMAGMLRAIALSKGIRFFLVQLDRVEAADDGHPPVGRLHVEAIVDAFEDIQGQRAMATQDSPARGAVHWDQSDPTLYPRPAGTPSGIDRARQAGPVAYPPQPFGPDAGVRCVCGHVHAHHLDGGACTWEVVTTSGQNLPCPCTAFQNEREVALAALCVCGHSYACHQLEGWCAYARGVPVSCECTGFRLPAP